MHIPGPENYIANNIVVHNCYVSRNRQLGNPLEIYQNVQEIWDSILSHYNTLGEKVPNQCDPEYWTYDIGESTDCGSPQMLPTTIFFLRNFLNLTNAKPSFATKVDLSKKLPRIKDPDNWGRVRVRTSLMPQKISTILEPATSKIIKRIESINLLVEKGYEVHINFSPVVLYEGWNEDYRELFKLVDSKLNDRSKEQLKCEVIMLTHSRNLHERNKDMFPEVEKLLFREDLQEDKINQRGSPALRYNSKVKPKAIETFKKILHKEIPYCKIRYIF